MSARRHYDESDESRRYQSLIAVIESVVSNLSLSDFFHAVSSCLKQFIAHDVPALCCWTTSASCECTPWNSAPDGIAAEAPSRVFRKASFVGHSKAKIN